MNIVLAKRARLYDALTLLSAIVVIIFDQWTKSLVVENLSPPQSRPPSPLIGDYLTIYYIQNSGAAFGLFANNVTLAVLIAIAICVITYFYVRMLNSGPLAYKLIFGMIIGGAVGNLLDRAIRGGYVVDFIWFRIPQIGYQFAIFNIADASISIGVILLFVFILVGGLRKSGEPSTRSRPQSTAGDHEAPNPPLQHSHPYTEPDAQH